VWVELRRGEHSQRLTYEDFEQRVKAGEVGPDVLLRFAPVTGESFVPASSLALYRSLADPGGIAFRKRLNSAGLPVVTAALAGVQLRLYLSSFDPQWEARYNEHFINWGPGLFEGGEIWRLVTYGLLHMNAGHLLLNLCFVVYTSWNLERALGRVNVLLLYFGAVISGGLLSVWMVPDRSSLGASGGAFGLIAASIALGWKRWDDLPLRARKSFGWALVPYAALSLISGIQSEGVDNWCHLGGLLGGLLMMTVLDADLQPARRRANALAQVGVGAVLMGLLALPALAGTRFVPLSAPSEGLLQVPHPTTWGTGWTLSGDRGFRSPLGAASVATSVSELPQPASLEEAVAPLLARLGEAGTVESVERAPITRDGWPGERLVVRFIREERPFVGTFEVFARGAYTLSIQFIHEAEAEGRYAPLRERIFAAAHIEEPAALVAAEAAVAANPRSFQPRAELGRQRRLTGDLPGAIAAYEEALAIAPDEPSVWVGLLACRMADGGPEARALATRALERFPDDPSVILAGVELYEALGDATAATAALDQAWARLPGDRVLRRARLRRGLSVELGP
jgi:rhomboid protease GluP